MDEKLRKYLSYCTQHRAITSANANKCHLLVTSNTNITAKIEDLNIKNKTEEKRLGIKFDSEPSFENHVSSLCKMASQKLHALAQIDNYIDIVSLLLTFNIFHTLF